MTLAVIQSRTCVGISAPEVTVEAHLLNGLPRFNIVGLPETAVKESKDRVRSAIINSQFFFPTKRITINLAPAELPKEGSRFDLPIALGILVASKQIPIALLSDYEFVGELALSGELRPIRGTLPISLAVSKKQRRLIIPKINADEATLVKTAQVLPAQHLLEVCSHLVGKSQLSIHSPSESDLNSSVSLPDLSDVYGQQHAKRALEIAATGGHSLLMMGPPGTGKTMLASRLPGLLPPMIEEEALALATIKSISGKPLVANEFYQRPFRAPHHSASPAALVGGGRPPKPGEISLAHHGVLFLDELPEFNRNVLESLREPLESGAVTISRASHQEKFPAQFQLIAAMNPCPCGYLGNKDNSHCCQCTPDKIHRYQGRISGPLLDRIDLYVEVPQLPQTYLIKQQKTAESSDVVRARVALARKIQHKRSGKTNAMLQSKELENNCELGKEEKKLIVAALEKFGLSARSYHRILRVARSIADLEQASNINKNHLLEALAFRPNMKSLA